MKKKKRFLATVMMIVMLLTAVPLGGLGAIKANATSRTSADAINWLKSKEGQYIDYDGAYGSQCVDLIMAYYNYLGVSISGGNGTDYAYNALPSGWTRTAGGTPSCGDILVYSGKLGHVAIYESDYITWHQNWLGSGVKRVTTMYYRDIKSSDGGGYWGCIHPNFSSPAATPSKATINTGLYRFVTSLDSNKSLDIADKSKDCGANAIIYSNHTVGSQAFRVEPLGDGYYSIINNYSGMYLDVTGGSTADGANVEWYKSCNSIAQKWYFTDAGNGYYYIVAACNGRYLDVLNYGTADGTNVETCHFNGSPAQKWKLFATSNVNIPKGIYQFNTALASDKSIDISGASTLNKANAQIFQSNSSNAQLFRVEPVGNYGYYTIINIGSGKCLDASDGGTVSGTNVYQYSNTNSDEQKWAFVDAGNGYYYIVSAISGLCLDVCFCDTADRTNVWLYTPNFTTAQKWKPTFSAYKVDYDLNNGVIDSKRVSTAVVNYIDEWRNDKCSIYTSNFGATTETNMYGYEVIVNSDHQVTGFAQYGQNNSNIPKGGFVISAHATSSVYSWLYTIKVGDYVAYDASTLTVNVYSTKNAMLYNESTKINGRTFGSLPIPTRTGYNFDGWYTAPSGGIKITEESMVNLTNDKTFYAHWISNVYSISYNANGGSGTPATQIKTHGQPLILSNNVPTRDGYTFLGWATSNSATSATYQAGGSYTADSNVTLYAVWAAKTYTVSYNANGGSGTPTTQIKAHGQPLTLSSNVPTRDGYTFLGWAASNSATSATYQAGGSYTADSNVTLYAVWAAKTYTVSYNANGGSGTPTTQIKTHGQPLTLSSNVPTRDGYTFLGWATSSSATSVTYQAGGSYTADSNVTLCAIWENNKENNNITLDQSYISLIYKGNALIKAESSYKVTWESSNTSIAAVDQNGHVYACGTGTAEITATITDNNGNTQSASCIVNVSYAFWQVLIRIFLLGFLWY
jgi:uncharacterized repeat protein (TIGR02543 family)